MTDGQRANKMVTRFLSLSGFDDPQLTADAKRLLPQQVAEINSLGLRESDLAVMGQAYIRAVGRVAAAEAEAISRLRDTAIRGSEEQLAAVVNRMLVLGGDVFDVLHSSLLRRAVTGDARSLNRSRRSIQPTAVAHVDVIGSTALLERATLSQTHSLVDGLFTSAQSAIRGRSVDVTKYVGDGVFLVGQDPLEVAEAAMQCIQSLAREAQLGSRAGLAYGQVVHRAGDVFGLPVNLCHILTKSATEGALLATAVGTARLPVGMCAKPREVVVRGLETALEAFEIAGD